MSNRGKKTQKHKLDNRQNETGGRLGRDPAEDVISDDDDSNERPPKGLSDVVPKEFASSGPSKQLKNLPANQKNKNIPLFGMSLFETAICLIIFFQSLLIAELYYTRFSSSPDLLTISSAVPNEIKTLLQSKLSDINDSNNKYKQEINSKLSDFQQTAHQIESETRTIKEELSDIKNRDVAGLDRQIAAINRKMEDVENLKASLDEIVELKNMILEMKTEWEDFEKKTEMSTSENKKEIESMTSRQLTLEDQIKEFETKVVEVVNSKFNTLSNNTEDRCRSLESKLGKTGHELNQKLVERLDTMKVADSMLSERMDNIQTKMDGVATDAKTYTDEKATELGGKIEKDFKNASDFMTQRADKLKQDIKIVEDKIQTVDTTLSGRLDKIDKTFIDVNTKIQGVFNDTKTYAQTKVQKLGKKIEEDFEKERGAMAKNMETVDHKLTELGDALQRAEERNNQKFSDMKIDIDGMGNKFDQKFVTSKTEFQNGMQKMMDVKNYLEIEQLTLKSQADDTRQRFMPFETAVLWYIIYGVLILILFIITQMKKDGKKLEIPEVKIIQPSNTVGYQPDVSVLDKISPQTLRHEVCVLSFYKETQPRHERLAKSAIPNDVAIVTTVVDNYDNILKIPHSKTFLVFVDFNERNIILENPEQETGTLKYTTVQGVGKLGGDVILVYVRDNGSKTLKDGQLFNTNLTSVYRHKGLSSLNDKNRVLSTYDEFTQYQRSHLSKIISKTLNINQ